MENKEKELSELVNAATEKLNETITLEQKEFEEGYRALCIKTNHALMPFTYIDVNGVVSDFKIISTRNKK